MPSTRTKEPDTRNSRLGHQLWSIPLAGEIGVGTPSSPESVDGAPVENAIVRAEISAASNQVVASHRRDTDSG